MDLDAEQHMVCRQSGGCRAFGWFSCAGHADRHIRAISYTIAEDQTGNMRFPYDNIVVALLYGIKVPAVCFCATAHIGMQCCAFVQSIQCLCKARHLHLRPPEALHCVVV